MNHMTEEKWVIRRQDPETVARIRREFGLSEPVARTLCNRDLTAPDAIRKFLKNDLDENLHDPDLLNDMAQATERIERAVKNGEKITIYGDYDVDGITSTVILYRYLSGRTAALDYYIPSRIEEGYGLNRDAVRTIREQGTTLLITVDTGTTAVEEIAYAKALGMDVIVTDHHECMDTLPDCPVVNPKRKDSRYPFPELAGVGVVFKLISALMGNPRKAFREYGGITAIGTIADIMPLLDENRSIVRYGLEYLEEDRPAGITALLNETGYSDSSIDTNVIAYQIAPRMNAAGRISNCRLSVDLLLETDPKRATALARQLCECNTERKEKEQQVVRDIDRILAGQPPKNKIMIYASENWHNGVIGIAASRLTERYSRPCILICFDGDSAKGSARSVRGVNLFELVGKAAEQLENFGGHEMAVGLTLKRENYARFAEQITQIADDTVPDDALIPTCESEFEVGAEAFCFDFTSSLKILEPFGNGNPYPLVTARELRVRSVTGVGGGKHTRLTLEKDGREFSAMWFGHAPEEIGIREGDPVDITCTVAEKYFHQKQMLNVTIRSIRPAEENEDGDLHIYRAFRENGADLPDSCRIDRTMMAVFYRYLTAEAVHNGGGEFRLHPSAAIRAINNNTGAGMNSCRLRLCMDTLVQLGLLRCDGQDGMTLTICRTREKADLTKTPDWDRISLKKE